MTIMTVHHDDNTHKLDPFQYYVAIMKKIPLCNTLEDFEAFLPWNIILG